ncbi:MAG TPA: hypothetical protein VGH98_21970 [Gemmatimonadaceae bacterium]|jgi:hypothetical protein
MTSSQPRKVPGSFPGRADDSSALVEVPHERRILAMAGEVRRVGRWAVPRLLRVRSFLGEVKIDLRGNTIPEGFTLDARAYGSRVTLIVPPGVNVMFDVFALMANAINQAHEPTGIESATQVVRVVGAAYLGEIRVLVRDVGA